MNSETERQLRALVKTIMAQGAATHAAGHAQTTWQKQRFRLLLEMGQPNLAVMPPTLKEALEQAYLAGVNAGAFAALATLQGLQELKDAAEPPAGDEPVDYNRVPFDDRKGGV